MVAESLVHVRDDRKITSPGHPLHDRQADATGTASDHGDSTHLTHVDMTSYLESGHRGSSRERTEGLPVHVQTEAWFKGRGNGGSIVREIGLGLKEPAGSPRWAAD